MTLAQMAASICGKVNQSETEDLAACKGFLTLNHDMLWQEELWKDSLVEYRLTLSPNASDYGPTSSWLPTKAVLLLPTIIDRVMAVRSDARKLNIRRQEFFYRVDYDSFAKQGTAAEFVLLPRCVWEFDSAVALQVAVANPADAAGTFTVDLVDTDATGVTRSAVVMAVAAVALGTSERIDAALKTASAGVVTIQKTDGTSIVSLAAADTAGKKRERIRLVEIPTQSTVLRVLGKRVAPSFTNDLDEPGIRGSDKLLLALGQADMLERERQYAKAKLVRDEQAGPLLGQLKSIEVVQQSHNLQIIPEHGYGDDYLRGLAGVPW